MSTPLRPQYTYNIGNAVMPCFLRRFASVLKFHELGWSRFPRKFAQNGCIKTPLFSALAFFATFWSGLNFKVIRVHARSVPAFSGNCFLVNIYAFKL